MECNINCAVSFLCCQSDLSMRQWCCPSNTTCGQNSCLVKSVATPSSIDQSNIVYIVIVITVIVLIVVCAVSFYIRKKYISSKSSHIRNQAMHFDGKTPLDAVKNKKATTTTMTTVTQRRGKERAEMVDSEVNEDEAATAVERVEKFNPTGGEIVITPTEEIHKDIDDDVGARAGHSNNNDDDDVSHKVVGNGGGGGAVTVEDIAIDTSRNKVLVMPNPIDTHLPREDRASPPQGDNTTAGGGVRWVV
eukprot:PhF_6_TR15477/c0_g1_i1/m.24069